jgi:hypothetical protein
LYNQVNCTGYAQSAKKETIDMPNEIVFKTFRTYAGRYVYDRHTNSLAIISDEEYQELKRVEEGELSPDQSQVAYSGRIRSAIA